MAKSRVVAVGAAIWLLGASVCFAGQSQRGECQGIVDTYLTQPIQQLFEEFTAKDLKTQYAIYICAQQSLHPPLTILARLFASQGEVAARFLRDEMIAATDDRTIRDIVLVFRWMSRERVYDVSRDPMLMRLIEDRIGGMTSAWKPEVQGWLGELRVNRQAPIIAK